MRQTRDAAGIYIIFRSSNISPLKYMYFFGNWEHQLKLLVFCQQKYMYNCLFANDES
jgi:hypothetical protein